MESADAGIGIQRHMVSRYARQSRGRDEGLIQHGRLECGGDGDWVKREFYSTVFAEFDLSPHHEELELRPIDPHWNSRALCLHDISDLSRSDRITAATAYSIARAAVWRRRNIVARVCPEPGWTARLLVRVSGGRSSVAHPESGTAFSIEAPVHRHEARRRIFLRWRKCVQPHRSNYVTLGAAEAGLRGGVSGSSSGPLQSDKVRIQLHE